MPTYYSKKTSYSKKPYYGSRVLRTGRKWLKAGLKYGPAAASAAKAIMPYLPFNAEYKSNTITDTNTPDTGGLVITDLFEIAQGDGDSTRDGDRVKFTSVNVHINAKIHPSANQTLVRAVLCWDNFVCSADPPAVTDVITSYDGFRNLNMTKRYTVIDRDWETDEVVPT